MRTARAAGTSRKPYDFPRAVLFPRDSTSPAATPISGGRALFSVAGVSGRFLPDSHANLPGASASGLFFNGSSPYGRAGLLNFDTSPKPGSDTRRVGADAFHSSRLERNAWKSPGARAPEKFAEYVA